MVAHSRHIGIVSRQKTPFINGESDRRNLDMCPDTGWRFGRPPALQFDTKFQYPGRDRVAKRHGLQRSTSFTRQLQAVYRGGSGALQDFGKNQQLLPPSLLGRADNGRFNRPIWISGGN
jgi:hypothetical protein